MVLVTGDRCACEETAALIPDVYQAVVKEHVSRLAASSLHPDRACALIRGQAQAAVGAAGTAKPPRLEPGVLEVFVRTTDIAEAASWVRGIDRTGPRQLRIEGPDRLATYRAFGAAILLTRTVAAAV